MCMEEIKKDSNTCGSEQIYSTNALRLVAIIKAFIKNLKNVKNLNDLS